MNLQPARTLAPLLAAWALSACSSLMPPTEVASRVEAQWHAPLPHGGEVVALSQWWQKQGDPLLVELIDAAQAVSPTLAMAQARVQGARSQQAQAFAALMPSVGAQAGISRGVSQPNLAVSNVQQIGLQAAWEIDLVGANRAVSRAANANVEGSQALWHDARVSVAADVASLYYGVAHCGQQLALARRDAASRQETARLSGISAQAGFIAPAVAAMARASAADGASRATQQAAQCDLGFKALVALTALPEPALRTKIATAPVKPESTASLLVANVPAKTISQRPDIFAAERDVAVASAQVGSAQAQRFPRLSLSGAIGNLRQTTDGVELQGSTWSFGPLALTLPLWDSGQRAAAVEASQANYQSVVAVYQAKVRQAVREVEEALVNLNSAAARNPDALVATQGYAQSLAATQSRYAQGLASLVELEDARRNALAAESAQLALQLETQRAWVALYRALGGGFEPSAAVL